MKMVNEPSCTFPMTHQNSGRRGPGTAPGAVQAGRPNILQIFALGVWR